MTRRSVLGAAAVLAAVTAPSTPGVAADPAAFIAGLGAQLQIVARNVPSDQRPAEFRQLFDQDFDMPAIARFVFGRYWQIATALQQQELLAVFEDYLVSTYGDRLSAYADSGRAPIVIGSRPIEDGALVSSEVIFGRNPTQGGRGAPLAPIRVDWRLTEAGEAYKITDVIVDGVSMAITQRSEFAGEIQRQGGQVPALVDMLREETAGTAR
ncbi:MAG TPA: ABC transporter substrate-binding protein [Stellaceae bacterium]|nr:ABC transporter substrate-binding protein [Stellaceae bacterium]